MLKEAIFAKRQRTQEKVTVEAWGCDVYVVVMTGIERDQYEMELSRQLRADNMRNLRAFLLVRCLADEDGNRIFTNEDAERLGDEEWTVLEPLVQIAQRLNKLRDEDLQAAKGN